MVLLFFMVVIDISKVFAEPKRCEDNKQSRPFKLFAFHLFSVPAIVQGLL